MHAQALSTFGTTASHVRPLGLPTETIRKDASLNGAHVSFSPIPLAPTSSGDDVDDYDDAASAAEATEFPSIDDGSHGSLEEDSGRKSKDGSRKRTSILHMPQTTKQIFAYAYGEIEREKAAFSSSSHDLESVGGEYYGASHMVGKLRPPIELSFVDLSLFLKGSGKKILSNVTGKLTPGRVMAVMGPSGAGKTTFLNALAGKATHSRTTGAVFINGKSDSIQSYKSIIGFVPQDDIVHGNLTVEENLWFSASYR